MKALLRNRRDLLKRYGLALGSAALALLIRGSLPIRPGLGIYQVALAAVVVSAWYGGRGPGLFALVISAAGILYWLIPPADSFTLPTEYALTLGLFLTLGVVLIEFSVGRRRVEHALEESEGRFDMEFRIVRPDGGTRWIHSRGTLIRSEQGRPYRASGIAEDITDARRAEEALTKAQTELAHVTRATTMGQLAASIAHEVNQPLAAIVISGNACLHWLDSETPNLEQARQAVLR